MFKKVILAGVLALASVPAHAYQVYPGCNVPGTFAGHTWRFDPVNGKTQAAYTALGILNDGSVTGQGSVAHPWNSLKAVVGTKIAGSFGPDTGYTHPLLSTVAGSVGPVHPGDKLELMSGDYGDVVIGDFNLEIANSDWLTVVPVAGQAPVLDTLTISRTNKWVFDSIKVQSIKGTNGNTGFFLVTIGDQGVSYPLSDIILTNLNVSIADHAATTAWTQAVWLANARSGIASVGSPGNGTNGVPYSTCVSIANNHIHDVYQGILAMTNNTLVTRNEVDHFSADGLDYAANNLIITNNNEHDNFTIDPNHEDAMQGQNGPLAQGVPYNKFSNILIDSNLVVRQIDPNLKFPAYLQGIDAFDEDWTNITVTNNVIVTSSCYGINFGSIHDSLIANNTIVDDGQVVTSGCAPQVNVGSATHQGPPSSNVRVTNNTAAEFAMYTTKTNGIVSDHNVIIPLPGQGGATALWYVNGAPVFFGLPGSYTNSDNGSTLTVVSGGPASAFTTYSPSTFTYDLTPKAGGPLIGAGSPVGAPTTLVDILGHLRTAPWTVGAFDHAATLPQKVDCMCDHSVPLGANTITFPTLADTPLSNTPPALLATASSGLPISYASTTTGVCTVSGSLVAFVSSGVCSITASQAGNASYNPAVSVTQSFSIPTLVAGNVPFVPLHKYFISATGSDAANGLTPATAWATPNHAVVCGDVVVAAPGTYTGTFGSWGTVSNCPSTSGGVDGTGGIWMATLLCGGDVASCNFTNTAGTKTFGVNASNWAIEGMHCNGGGNLNICYNMSAIATSTTRLHHLAFVNDIAVNSSQGYQEDDNVGGGVGENSNVPGNGADYFAYVGSICQNCGQSGFGVAGFNVVFPSQWDSNPGTHIFVDGNFSYAISTQSSDDGEAYMVDTPDKHGYAAQIVESNNIGFAAARYCMAMTLDSYNTSFSATVKVSNFSCYGDGAAVPNTNAEPVAEFMFLAQSGSLTRPIMTFTNNLAQTSAATGDAGAVQLVALYEGYSGTFTHLTMSGNWWDAIGSSCTSGAGTCFPTTPPISAQFYPSNTPSGSDTFGTAPGYMNPTDLLANRTGAPNCTGLQTTVQCMGWNANTGTLTTPSIISDLMPTASGTAGKGYQRPSTICGPNADYPTWLKGIVYLHWNAASSTITENAGLVTKPCGM